MNGKDRNKKPDELKKYIYTKFDFICETNPSMCNFKIDHMTTESLEESPSVNLKRVDMERLPLF